ncbi:MAG: ABC transporter permease subunit, partial [Thermomicrobiales bacterium]|nr:ABC transporter permease subunit [Thermomicrobiales bacterium]
MTGFLALLRKEVVEIARTWRIWVLPGLLIFFGVSSPIMAEIAPRLVESFASDQPGTIIQIPDPVTLDAYRQLVKSLNQVALIALIIASADIVSGERRNGTIALLLTKPISRPAFVLAKVVAQTGLVTAAALVSAAVCWLGTRVIFSEAPLANLIVAVGLWLILATVLIAAMTLLSTVIRAQAGAAGAGIAVYAMFVLLGAWEPTRRHSPAGLFGAIDDAVDGAAMTLARPVTTAVVAIS